MLTADTVGVGGAHQGQWPQSIHLTETGTGPGLPQQDPGLLQLSLRLLPGTSASKHLRGARARQLGSRHK